jgi:hypothetical protein
MIRGSPIKDKLLRFLSLQLNRHGSDVRGKRD